MMKKLLTGLLLAAMVIMGAPAATYAHTTETDEHGKAGVMHISPTDNPAVGEDATIFLDIEGFDEGIDSAKLDIMLEGTHIDTLELEIGDNQLSANYVFEEAGDYSLDFSVESDGETSTFNYEQSVAGAVSTSLFAQPWALGLFAAAAIGLGILAALFVVYRKKVAEQSVPKH